MRGATATSPMTTEQIAERAGVNLMQARTHIGNCVHTRLAHNLKASGPGLYAWGQPTRAEPVNSPRSVPTDVYVPPKDGPVRVGSMDAYALPHLVNGERVGRTRPAIVGSRPAQAVGVHGGRVPV